MEKNFVYISKIDAAKRQLEMAIRLFFLDSDIVVIHTLIGATHNILSDLAKKIDIETLMGRDSFKRFVKKDKQEYMYEKIHEAKNFFKHADREYNKTVKFNPEITEFFIFDSCNLYERIVREKIPIVSVYNVWFFVKHQDVIDNQEQKQKWKNVGMDFPCTDKKTYLCTVLPFFEKESF